MKPEIKKTTPSWSIGSALDWTADYFSRLDISEARLEAEILLSSVLNCRRLDLHLRRDEVVPPEQLKQFRAFIEERRQRKPVAYILGEQEFMGLRFRVNEHTLIPRPETELLVEETVKLVKAGHDSLLADIGTGSGAIAVSTAALSPLRKIYATDISFDTLKIAQENINAHGLAGRVIVKQGNMLAALNGESLEGSIDIIISNPPYVAEDEAADLAPELGFEPRAALFGGKDGLDFYRVLAKDARTYLKPEGFLLLELSAQKSSLISDILEVAGFAIISLLKDYSGLDRVIIAQMKRNYHGQDRHSRGKEA